MVQSVSLEQLRKDAVDIFHNGFACSESVIYSIRKNFELDMSDDAFAMSTGFPWGLGGAGCLCGAVAGGTMCIGYVFGRRKPGEPAGECHRPLRRQEQSGAQVLLHRAGRVRGN